jgi:hypothetical protein
LDQEIQTLALEAKATEGKVENGDRMEELEWKVELKSSHVTLIYTGHVIWGGMIT